MRLLLTGAIALAALLGSTVTFAAPRAPCEAIKSRDVCVSRDTCAWVKVGKGKRAVNKCRTIRR
jgi:hypothetical protein